MKIKVVPYQPEWQFQFEQIKSELMDLLQELNPVIEHIGSTSIVNLPAKPIIDICVGLASEKAFGKVVERMQSNGHYIYFKAFNKMMPNRRLFVRLKNIAAANGLDNVFELPEDIPHELINDIRTAHVHVWQLGTKDWIRHIAFRDYLREHEAVKNKYEQIKLHLSKQDWQHGMAYNDGKNDFIKATEQKAVEWFRQKHKV